jgi:hypothetical protein
MGMGPARRYAASLALVLSACGVWAQNAWSVAEPVQNCPGNFPYTGEFSFPVAPGGFADDCRANGVDPQGRLTHFRAP